MGAVVIGGGQVFFIAGVATFFTFIKVGVYGCRRPLAALSAILAVLCGKCKAES